MYKLINDIKNKEHLAYIEGVLDTVPNFNSLMDKLNTDYMKCFKREYPNITDSTLFIVKDLKIFTDNIAQLDVKLVSHEVKLSFIRHLSRAYEKLIVNSINNQLIS